MQPLPAATSSSSSSVPLVSILASLVAQDLPQQHKRQPLPTNSPCNYAGNLREIEVSPSPKASILATPGETYAYMCSRCFFRLLLGWLAGW
uniref:Putative secreted protein n=1 Tax=Anopheles darlingi TaxID=43151 RepID=A0A2M4DD64_ANODA